MSSSRTTYLHRKLKSKIDVLFTFHRLSLGLYYKLCNVYCIQCNDGTVCLIYYPYFQSLNQSCCKKMVKIKLPIAKLPTRETNLVSFSVTAPDFTKDKELLTENVVRQVKCWDSTIGPLVLKDFKLGEIWRSKKSKRTSN